MVAVSEVDSATAIDATVVDETAVVVSGADSPAVVRVPVEVSTAVERSVALVSLHSVSTLVSLATSVDKVSLSLVVPLGAVVRDTSEVAVADVSTEVSLEVDETSVELSKVKEVEPEVKVADDSRAEVVEMGRGLHGEATAERSAKATTKSLAETILNE